jgi:hypothetical protein
MSAGKLTVVGLMKTEWIACDSWEIAVLHFAGFAQPPPSTINYFGSRVGVTLRISSRLADTQGRLCLAALALQAQIATTRAAVVRPPVRVGGDLETGNGSPNRMRFSSSQSERDELFLP